MTSRSTTDSATAPLCTCGHWYVEHQGETCYGCNSLCPCPTCDFVHAYIPDEREDYDYDQWVEDHVSGSAREAESKDPQGTQEALDIEDYDGWHLDVRCGLGPVWCTPGQNPNHWKGG